MALGARFREDGLPPAGADRGGFDVPHQLPVSQPPHPGRRFPAFSAEPRFGPAGATRNDLASDVYQAFTTAFPSTLTWTDHRPIASLFLTSYNGTYPKNPRRWFGDGAVDITTPAGVVAFQQRLLKDADGAVARCKAEGRKAP